MIVKIVAVEHVTSFSDTDFQEELDTVIKRMQKASAGTLEVQYQMSNTQQDVAYSALLIMRN